MVTRGFDWDLTQFFRGKFGQKQITITKIEIKNPLGKAIEKQKFERISKSDPIRRIQQKEQFLHSFVQQK